MTELVRRRHPRLAVWMGRLGEHGIPLACLVAAVISGLVGDWDVIPGWILAAAIALAYQHRLENAWLWGWRTGRDDALRRVMPYIQLDRSNLDELNDAFMVEGPTWRQRQDELSQIDAKATMKANMEQLQRMWADMDERLK